MLLQFCGKTEVNRVSAITNAEHHHTTTPELRKGERKVGLALRDFRVRDFTISNAKHQHTTTPEF
jgi:hypothetical protein